MAKTLIVSPDGGTPVPFLRGILTHTLQGAGLTFDDAYELASKIRNELSEIPQISTIDLRKRVVAHLRETHGPLAVNRYLLSSNPVATVGVRGLDGLVSPFSREQYRRILECAGLSAQQALNVTERLHNHLLKRGAAEIQSRWLGYLTYRLLRRRVSSEVAGRYMNWVDFQHSGRPLILLIGGTSGCGKSTTATALANQLDIVRTQSTDMLREVMRMMIPERLLPGLYASSFSAWQALPPRDIAKEDREDLVADGYRAQAWLLSVPCEAVIQRALRERVSLILEGVHIQPLLLEKVPADTDAIVVSVMIAVLKRDQLRRQIKGRGKYAASRRAERYLEHFDDIWRLQAYLLAEADRAGIPIIANNDPLVVLKRVLEVITDTLSRNFTSNPREVFLNLRQVPDVPGTDLS
jgi:2-phosphoglycerate kinase